MEPLIWQWRIQEKGPAPSPLILDQNEARRAEKNFLGDRPPPTYLKIWVTVSQPLSPPLPFPPPPPPHLKVWIRNCLVLLYSKDTSIQTTENCWHNLRIYYLYWRDTSSIQGTLVLVPRVKRGSAVYAFPYMQLNFEFVVQFLFCLYPDQRPRPNENYQLLVCCFLRTSMSNAPETPIRPFDTAQ